MSARRWLAARLRPAGSELPLEDWAVACQEALAELGCLGTEERGEGAFACIVAWLPEGADAGRVPGLLAEASLAAEVLACELVEDPGWVEQFNASLKPIDVGRRLTILPRPGPVPEGRVGLVIEPGRAFGTGHHESTRLALEQLEARVRPGCSVLDVGTGSGLLALAAARLGAARVIGIDIDPEAIEVALENVSSQPEASRIRLESCGDPALVEGTFDVVVANIQADVLHAMLPALLDRVAGSGHLILAGLLKEDRQAMNASLVAFGLDVEWTQEGEWVAACAQSR